MRNAAARAVFATAAVVGLSACAQTGTVEGDVYFKTTAGEIRRASGTRVLLLRGEDSVLAKMRRACDAHMTEQRRLHKRYMAIDRGVPGALVFDPDAFNALIRRAKGIEDSMTHLKRATVTRLDSLIWSAVADSATTRLDARFRFESLKSGDYILWADDRFGTETAQWIAPVSIEAGKTSTVDLNPEREKGLAANCFIGRTEVR